MADKTAFDYVNEIWSIANYVRDVIRPADYNKLILGYRTECVSAIICFPQVETYKSRR